jgi:DNA repair protein RadC
MSSTKDVKQYCQLAIANEPDEWFCCIFLNNQHQLITFEKLFRCTVGHTNVHPRVILRRALELNSAALILVHNHPSGSTRPSTSDINITKKLTTLLSEIDVRVLDHLIVTTSTVTSMADLGLLPALVFSSVRMPSQNLAPSFSDNHMPSNSLWPSAFTPSAK